LFMNAILGHVFGCWKQPMQIGCYGMECRDRFAPINIVHNNNQSVIFSSTERFLFIFLDNFVKSTNTSNFAKSCNF